MNTFINNGARWTYDEHVIAFNLYCKLPFGQLHRGNREIIKLATLLGRTPDSIAMKLSNFASLDPSLQKRGIRGLRSISKDVVKIWEEFESEPEQLVYKGERLLADRLGSTIEKVSDVDVRDLPPPGIDRDAIVRVRVNQNFFRRRILSAFEFRCCVTGLDVLDLLVASHIVPWSIDLANRLNPRNGLCLNALHDRAFDRGLMWIDEGYIVRFSSRLSKQKETNNAALCWLMQFDGKPLRMPKNFSPDINLLRKHKETLVK